MNNNFDGIAAGRTVSLEIKIPNGQSCRKCKAKYFLTRTDQFCILYHKRLGIKSYESSKKTAWGSRETKYAAYKCEDCLCGRPVGAEGKR